MPVVSWAVDEDVSRPTLRDQGEVLKPEFMEQHTFPFTAAVSRCPMPRMVWQLWHRVIYRCATPHLRDSFLWRFFFISSHGFSSAIFYSCLACLAWLRHLCAGSLAICFFVLYIFLFFNTYIYIYIYIYQQPFGPVAAFGASSCLRTRETIAFFCSSNKRLSSGLISRDLTSHTCRGTTSDRNTSSHCSSFIKSAPF